MSWRVPVSPSRQVARRSWTAVARGCSSISRTGRRRSTPSVPVRRACSSSPRRRAARRPPVTPTTSGGRSGSASPTRSPRRTPTTSARSTAPARCGAAAGSGARSRSRDPRTDPACSSCSWRARCTSPCRWSYRGAATDVARTMICPACGHENRGGARFCAECGGAVPAPGCVVCGTELRPGAHFCDHCGMPVAGEPPPALSLATPAPGHGDERKRITALFADLAGSTAMQEALDLEVVRRIMGRWSGAMRSAIEGHGGLSKIFAGEGIVATWGAQAIREDDALRALTAAWAMRTALVAINEELEARFGLRLGMRTGLHTGDVVVSAEGFLVGDTMNTGARLEQHAPEGEILVGRRTYQLVRDHAE